MTSNIGSEFLIEGVDAAGEIVESARTAVMSGLRSHFRPEFLNRIDDIVLFKPLTRGELSQIVDLQMAEMNRRLAAQGLTVKLSADARDQMAAAAYDPAYGARPLRRYIQHQLETRVGRAIISGEARPGTVVQIGLQAGELAVVLKNDLE
jgi:ATP-dependent Clp protease ATP-binding subunit ClpB